MESHPSPSRRFPDPRLALAVPLLALAVVAPLLRHGPSCGHDFDFHVQSWIEAAAQIRHGVLLPHWAYAPAYNAGEPRFVFYPPLSWLLGALLLLILPAPAAPVAFTWVALVLASWGLWSLARRFTDEAGALLATALYLANPYMLFTLFERTAFAELLAAAWLPWLLRAALSPRLRVVPLAFPVALLWLTNAPAAVMGTYALAFILCLRVALGWWHRRSQPGRQASLRLAAEILATGGAGLLLGLALAGFYLLPAAWERRYVQIAMAIIPNMRVEDNFLFGHTGNGPHDQVLHTASLVALTLLALTAVTLGAALLRRRRHHEQAREQELALPALLGLAAVIALLLFPCTRLIWQLLPELAFLQFPWRWLAVLGCLFGTGVAVLVGRTRVPFLAAAAASLLLVAGCSALGSGVFRQGCEANELPADRLALLAGEHGIPATDEYTPITADNDQLRWDDPGWWLAASPNDPGPHTVPNPAATIENYDVPPPLAQTVSGRAPTHLHLKLEHPQILVLNLRAFPAWRITVNGSTAQPLQRDDGLVALALKAGAEDVDVRWHRLPDVWLGDALSLCALAVVGQLQLRSRRIKR